MSNHNESGSPEVPDSRRRPNPYAGKYGLPGPTDGSDPAAPRDGDAQAGEPTVAPSQPGVVRQMPQYGAQSGYMYGEAPGFSAAPDAPESGPLHAPRPPYIFGQQTRDGQPLPEGQADHHGAQPGPGTPDRSVQNFGPAPHSPAPHSPAPHDAPAQPTLHHPFSDRLPVEYLNVPPRTGARDDVEVSLMEAPWYQPNPQFGAVVPPSAANNWLGANSFAAMWGRGWGLWRRAAGPLTLAFLLFVAVPILPLVPSFQGMIDVMAGASREALSVQGPAQEALMRSVEAHFPSSLQILASLLLTVVGSIPFTNGLVTLARVGSLTMREMWSFKHAVPISVVGLIAVLLSLNTALNSLNLIYMVLTFFAGYIIVAEGLGLRRAFTRPFSVAVGNMSSVLLLVAMWLMLVGGGVLGFGMLGVLFGTFLTLSSGMATGLWVAMLLSFGSMIITYPVWLCMVTTTALRATKRVDFVRAILQRTK